MLSCLTIVSRSIDTAAGEMVNISQYVTVSGADSVTYSPSEVISLSYQTLDAPEKVTATAMDQYGASSSCSFLVYTQGKQPAIIHILKYSLLNDRNLGWHYKGPLWHLWGFFGSNKAKLSKNIILSLFGY